MRAQARLAEEVAEGGVCRLLQRGATATVGSLNAAAWLECTSEAMPVVVVLDLNASPEFKDMSHPIALIERGGVCLSVYCDEPSRMANTLEVEANA